MSLTDSLSLLDQVLACLAAAAAGLVGYGFLRLAFRHSGSVGHLATGLLLMHLVVVSRSLYLGTIRFLVSPEVWTAWLALNGDHVANLVLNALVVLAGYHSLKALKLSIPPEIRDEYSLIGTAFYPRLRVFDILRDFLLACWRRLRR